MEKIVFGAEQLSLLDKLIQFLRFRRIQKEITNIEESIVVDCGSGYHCKLLHTIKAKKRIGLDMTFPCLPEDGIERVSADLEQAIPLEDASVDVVVSLALIEHLHNFQLFVNEIHRILAPNGKLILTTPSKKSQWLLEFLAYKLYLISESQIRDHKNYFDKNDLINILVRGWFQKENITHRYFQFGYNNYIVGIKK